jgi:hypothetical protein
MPAYKEAVMKYFHLLPAIILVSSVLCAQNTSAQSIPTVDEVNKLISNNQILVTYREGEVVYGTYFFIEIHYCPAGYGLYGKTVKKTVLGNEQINKWQEFGTWKVIKYNENVGIYYKTTTGQEKYFPVYRLPNGNLSLGEGVSIVLQGKAICN